MSGVIFKFERWTEIVRDAKHACTVFYVHDKKKQRKKQEDGIWFTGKRSRSHLDLFMSRKREKGRKKERKKERREIDRDR